jgi:hypothetical protein
MNLFRFLVLLLDDRYVFGSIVSRRRKKAGEQRELCRCVAGGCAYGSARERKRSSFGLLGCSRISQELLLLLLRQKALSFFVELRVGLFGLQNQRLRKGAVGRKDLRG